MAALPCSECNGSGLEVTPVSGKVTAHCRACQGSGCPRLGRLLCTKTGHPHGHTYDGQSVTDGHDTSEQRAEATRG